MQFSRKLFLSLAVALSALIAGCGGGSDSAALSAEKFAAAKSPQSPLASVTSAAAAELLMDAAEVAYPNLFQPHQPTQSFGPIAFRYYPATGMYLGVAITASAQYTLNGVYVVGTGFGTLQNPAFQGVVTQFINVQIGGGTPTGHTLVVTVNVAGVNSTITLNDVPAPTSQADFCSDLAADTTFTQIAAGGGGTMTIKSCSFNGTTGNIAAQLSVNYGGFSTTVDYTITYTYQ